MIQMDGGDRLRVTLLDRMTTVENGRSSVTLEDVLKADMSASHPQAQSRIVLASPARNHSNRSLLDVMRSDRRRDKTTWKSLRDKLRLRSTSTAWISSNLIPALDTPIPTLNNNSHRFSNLGYLLSNSDTNRSSDDFSYRAEEETEREDRPRLGTVLAEERELSSLNQPPRMSLMELLEDNDGPMYDDVSERGEVEDGGTTSTTVAELGCCVCMIRNKGAAFIPCGHTFCRLCSRELWLQRGNCPLCNTSIIEVLDIF